MNIHIIFLKEFQHKLCVLMLLCFLMPVIVQAQRTEAELTFKDGTIKKGLGKLSGKHYVKFKTNKGDKAIKYDFSQLDMAKINGRIYQLVTVKEGLYPKVLERVLVGKVYLYQLKSQGYMPYGGTPGNFGGGVGFAGGDNYSINNFYVRRENEDRVTHLGSDQLFTKNFKKAASEYFKDCQQLVYKIEEGEYKKRDLNDIIQYYNGECE